MVKSTKALLIALLLVFALVLLAGCVRPPASTDSASQPQQPTTEIAIHFLDAGQADSALVLCGGKTMLIDGGNREDSSLLYTYLKKQGITHLDYVVATHAHEDHIGGLSGALNYASAGTVYCPTTKYDSDVFESFVKYVSKSGARLTVPKAGDSFGLGDARVDILACNAGEDTNNTSIVLKITHGETSFLFTGDAERETEQAILSAGYNVESTLLKVGHHGSETSTSYPFLRAVMPRYAVISVGADNSYGHPTQEVLSRLNDAEVSVYRTDLMGTIICTGNGKALSFAFPDKESGEQSQHSATQKSYILNTSSRVFHLTNCTSVGKMSTDNKRSFTGTRNSLLMLGYVPCGNCNP